VGQPEPRLVWMKFNQIILETYSLLWGIPTSLRSSNYGGQGFSGLPGVVSWRSQTRRHGGSMLFYPSIQTWCAVSFYIYINRKIFHFTFCYISSNTGKSLFSEIIRNNTTAWIPACAGMTHRVFLCAKFYNMTRLNFVQKKWKKIRQKRSGKKLIRRSTIKNNLAMSRV